MTETNEAKLESFQAFRRDIHAIISTLRARIGRMPTEDEVVDFIWAESDEERQKLFDKMKSA